MTWTTDNRWSAGASGATVPDDAPAVYSARWIDMGDRADILPDRQGFAYNDPVMRDRLIALLTSTEPHLILPSERDKPIVIKLTNEWRLYQRRAGGYVYVDAWLTPGGWLVTCEDGEVRHDGLFENRTEAERFANWGHACTVHHRYERVEARS